MFDRLYCEEIDVGEASPRQVASGLREHYSLEEMNGRRLIVVCNLKEAKMMGFTSYGMVLAAKSDTGKVELVSPPEGAAIGERVTLEGDTSSGQPWSSARVKKYKVWETVAKDLRTDEHCVATWQGRALVVNGMKCTVTLNSNSPIA